MVDNFSAILAIQKNRILIEASGQGEISILSELGAKRGFFKRSRWAVPFQTEQEKIECLNKLQAAGFLFSGGAGWSPAAIFLQLRDAGKVHGVFKEIVWKQPGEFLIREL